MSSRGIVMEAKGSKLVVLTEEGSFRRVRRLGNEMIGQEIVITAQRRLLRVPKAVLPASAVILLLLALPAFWSSRAEAHPVVAYLSLDVNPSFEIGVDRDLNVRRLTAMNADARPFVQGLDFDGLPAEQVISQLARKLAESSYLDSGGSEIILAGVKLDAEADQALTLLDREAKQALLTAAGNSSSGMHVTSLESTEEVREEASARGMSTGRMTVYLLAKSQGYDVSLDQFRSGAIQEAVSWKGGVDALVSDSQKIDSDKLHEQLDLEKEEAKGMLPTPSLAAKASPAHEDSASASAWPAATPASQQPAKPAPSSKPGAKPDGPSKQGDKFDVSSKQGAKPVSSSKQGAKLDAFLKPKPTPNSKRMEASGEAWKNRLAELRSEAEKQLKLKADASHGKPGENSQKASEKASDKEKEELEKASRHWSGEREQHKGKS